MDFGQTSRSGVGVGREARAQRLLVWLVIVSFALQSYITQTHVHSGAASGTSGAAAVDVFGGPHLERDRSGTPVKAPADDPAHCQVCKAIAASGHFFLPVPPLLPLPTATITACRQIWRAVLLVAAPAHSWYGRGPPQR
jgi:hypothetical protein